MKMKARHFNAVMHIVHETWAAKVLNLQVNPQDGPDLIAADKILELKFTLRTKKGNYPLAWTVLEYQMRYRNWKAGYWGLGVYALSTDIQRIRTVSPRILEKMVGKRELYIVPWDWMNQFPPHQTQGKTKRSEWNNVLRYPKLKYVPPVINTYEVEKGLVHITEGVPLDTFEIRRKIEPDAIPGNAT